MLKSGRFVTPSCSTEAAVSAEESPGTAQLAAESADLAATAAASPAVHQVAAGQQRGGTTHGHRQTEGSSRQDAGDGAGATQNLGENLEKNDNFCQLKKRGNFLAIFLHSNVNYVNI